MQHFIRKSKETVPDDLVVRSPRAEFERFAAQRLAQLEKAGNHSERELVQAALEIGRDRLSTSPGGRLEEPPAAKVGEKGARP